MRKHLSGQRASQSQEHVSEQHRKSSNPELENTQITPNEKERSLIDLNSNGPSTQQR